MTGRAVAFADGAVMKGVILEEDRHVGQSLTLGVGKGLRVTLQAKVNGLALQKGRKCSVVARMAVEAGLLLRDGGVHRGGAAQLVRRGRVTGKAKPLRILLELGDVIRCVGIMASRAWRIQKGGVNVPCGRDAFSDGGMAGKT